MAKLSALDVLGILRLEDGRRWADAACDFQVEDATAVLTGNVPYHFLTRARGASKTSDLGAVALGLLLTAPGRARLYWVASDREQGQLAIHAIAGFVDRSPVLRDALVVTGSAVQSVQSKARLDVLASDASGSWGLLPYALFCDELAQWPETPAPQTLWESVSSAVAKTDGAKLVVLTTAGDPAHWARKILDHALGSSMWRVNEVPGPSPWMSPERVEEQRARLLPSAFARLFLNVWTASEDRLATPEELRACVKLDGPQEYDPAFTYVIAADLGIKRDRTVCCVAHLAEDGKTTVMDRMAVWRGSSEEPVPLSEVEAWIVQASGSYGGARVVADPWQGVGMLQRLVGQHIEASEFPFTAVSVGRLAAALFNAIRDRTLALPADEELLDELAHVRLRETSPGVFKLDHDSGRHNDRAVSLALAVTTLLRDEPASEVFAEYTPPPRGTPAGDYAYERGESTLAGDFDPDSFGAEDRARGVGGDGW